MKPLPFNLKTISLCFLTITLITFSSLGYNENQENASSDTNQNSFSSWREAWVTIERSSKSLGKQISSNSASSLHKIQKDLNRGLTYLETNSATIATNNTERFKISVREALESSKKIYHETERKLSKTASKELERLQRAIESIKAQLPTNIFSQTNQVIKIETNRSQP